MHTYTHTWFLTPNCMNKFARSHATPSYICWWWKCSIDVTKKLYFLFWAARITSSGALPWILFDCIIRIHVDLFQPVLPVYIFKIYTVQVVKLFQATEGPVEFHPKIVRQPGLPFFPWFQFPIRSFIQIGSIRLQVGNGIFLMVIHLLKQRCVFLHVFQFSK